MNLSAPQPFSVVIITIVTFVIVTFVSIKLVKAHPKAKHKEDK